jgi:ABC-type Fe3+ transport system permease subunit/DNA-binding beta-propeller fold protein YncE
MNWTLLQNSLLVSGLTTLLSVMLGFCAALWLAGLENNWRIRWLTVAIVALSLPPFLVTNCWLHYLGRMGVWRGWLPFDIFSLGGTVWILTLLTWPVTLFATLGAWQRLEAAQMESDVAVTGTAFIRGLLLPYARTSLIQAGLITFVLALNNFAVPAILQVKVFPAEVWVQFNSSFDSVAAFRTSWPLVLVPILLLFWFRRRKNTWPKLQGAFAVSLYRQQLGAGWLWFSGAVTLFLVLVSVGLPLLQLGSSQRMWNELPGAIAAGQAAIWNSFWLAAVSASLCVIVSLICWRLPMGLALWLPFLIPGVLSGIAMILLFNRPVLSAFYQSVGIVILAFVVRYLGFGWNGIAHAMKSTDSDLVGAARLEGASWWQSLRHVHWPQISLQVAATWYVIFLLCLWDVESMVLVVPPGGETLALRVFNLLHFGHNNQVDALCLTLLGLAILPVIIWKIGRGIYSIRNKTAIFGSFACVLAISLLLTGCSDNQSKGQRVKSNIFSNVQVVGTRGVGVGEFNKPRSVAVDKQDNLYVVDMTGRVQKFSPDGKFLLSWQMPQTDLGKPKGMCCDKEGNIIVLEPHYQRVNHFTPEGKLVAQWGVKGTNAGQLTLPRCVAVNSHNDVFVTEYTVVDRVQQFSAKGAKALNCFGQAGLNNGEFSRAEGMDIDSADRLYIADSCNHRIQVFSGDGKWLRTYGKAGAGTGDLSYPYDIRLDKEGRQYVCEFGNSRIQIFDANDKPLEILGGIGGAPGQLNNPWSIALDSKGNLYVADSQNHRVQKFLKKNQTASLVNGEVKR